MPGTPTATSGGHYAVEVALRAQFGEGFRPFGAMRRRRNELEYPSGPARQPRTTRHTKPSRTLRGHYLPFEKPELLRAIAQEWLQRGLVRQYLPKGTDLLVHVVATLAAVETKLNTRPRKILGRKTAHGGLRTGNMIEVIAATIAAIRRG